ncbi:hypothetical protein TNCV_2328861 [Trichonephila clavipes]|nr:hypothetical protein TNCV_2328861 [Trichonephila clavipes]
MYISVPTACIKSSVITDGRPTRSFSNTRLSEFQILNDDDIVTSVQAEFDFAGEETDEDEDNNDKSSKGAPNAGVFFALENSYEVVQQQSVCCPTQLLPLKRVSETLQRKSEGVQWYSEK